MSRAPVVSRQIAVLGTQIVWATTEDNGVGEYRWSLWIGGRSFTIRHRGQDGSYTGIDERPGSSPHIATKVGEESFQIEFPFHLYRRRITFHVGLMTAVVTDLDRRSEPTCNTGPRVPEPSAVPTCSRHSTFTLEADAEQAEAAAVLRDVVYVARSEGEVAIGRWTLRSEDANSAQDLDEVVRVVATLVGMPLARIELLRPAVSDALVDALRFGSDAIEYMTEEVALDCASWFLEWFGPRATFYIGTQKQPDWAVVIIGIDADQVGALATVTRWGQ